MRILGKSFMNSFVYILTNKFNRVLYTGVTNDLERRIYEHRSRVVEGFTKKYNLTKLVYFEGFSNISDAIAAEKIIKGWLRKKKIQLIESKNPRWRDLTDVFGMASLCRHPEQSEGSHSTKIPLNRSQEILHYVQNDANGLGQ
jgi:putative endonuclease